MATYSGNTTIKYSGTQVAVSRTTTGTMYTVPAGKTLVGGWHVQTFTAGASITIDGVKICDMPSNGAMVSGVLYVSAGSVVACTIATSSTCSIHGVLQENTP